MQRNTGASALYAASQNGHIAVVRELIARNADIDSPDNNGWSALMIACEHGHIDIVRRLLLSGASLDFDGLFAMEIASNRGYLNILTMLLRCEALHNKHKRNELMEVAETC